MDSIEIWRDQTSPWRVEVRERANDGILHCRGPRRALAHCESTGDGIAPAWAQPDREKRLVPPARHRHRSRLGRFLCAQSGGPKQHVQLAAPCALVRAVVAVRRIFAGTKPETIWDLWV